MDNSEVRCHVVQQTRLDTARIRAARRVIDPFFGHSLVSLRGP